MLWNKLNNDGLLKQQFLSFIRDNESKYREMANVK